MRNALVIQAQQTRLIEMYERHVAPGTPYALVDFPDHSNVGDSAIWVGEIALLRKITGRAPSYVSRKDNFDLSEFRRACPSGPLFIHGGGNLGDIWAEHQAFREMLMSEVRDRQLVQLPQSIKFYDAAASTRFATATGRHPDFHLYVRDQPSLRMASESYHCAVQLTPDSAFGMGAHSRAKSSVELLMLMRTDLEKVELEMAPFRGLPRRYETVDWLGDDNALQRAKRLHSRMKRRWRGLDRGRLRVSWYNWLAEQRVRRGFNLLSRGQQVITDRLHGHIMSTLADIPHVALDNSYGKVSGYINAWTKAYSGVRTATTAHEAVMLLETLPNDYA